MATTQEVWDHHAETFAGRDLKGLLEDYTDESLIIANGEKIKGLKEIEKFFGGLFEELPKDCAFELPHCIVLEKNVYITWNASTDAVAYEFATDTFTIEGGKITLQTVGFVKKIKTAA